MLPKTLRKEVNLVIETAVMLSDRNLPAEDLAKSIIDRESNLMRQTQECLILDFMTNKIRKMRGLIQPLDRPIQQLDFPGFEHIPYRITVDYERIVLRKATLKNLTSYLLDLQNKAQWERNAKIRAVEELIRIVTPYDKKHDGITVGAVMAAENRKRNLEQFRREHGD